VEVGFSERFCSLNKLAQIGKCVALWDPYPRTMEAIHVHHMHREIVCITSKTSLSQKKKTSLRSRALASCSLVTVIESSCAEIQIYVNLQAFNGYGSNCLPIHITDWIETGSAIHHHIRKSDIVRSLLSIL
jgi:hypothetical protein